MTKDEIDARLVLALPCELDSCDGGDAHHHACPAYCRPAVRALLVAVAQAQREADEEALHLEEHGKPGRIQFSGPLVIDESGRGRGG